MMYHRSALGQRTSTRVRPTSGSIEPNRAMDHGMVAALRGDNVISSGRKSNAVELWKSCAPGDEIQ